MCHSVIVWLVYNNLIIWIIVWIVDSYVNSKYMPVQLFVETHYGLSNIRASSIHYDCIPRPSRKKDGYVEG